MNEYTQQEREAAARAIWPLLPDSENPIYGEYWLFLIELQCEMTRSQAMLANLPAFVRATAATYFATAPNVDMLATDLEATVRKHIESGGRA